MELIGPYSRVGPTIPPEKRHYRNVEIRPMGPKGHIPVRRLLGHDRLRDQKRPSRNAALNNQMTSY
jgi:hypothetical protein